MKKLLLSLIFLIIFTNINAQIVNIPDANFKAFLVNDTINININADSEIQVSEAINVYSINAYGANISNLTGIESFVNIQYLNVANNQLNKIDVSSNIDMRTLYCSSNLITTQDSINISNTPNLTLLSLAYNNLGTLNISHPGITNFFCDNCNLSSLNISNLPALTNLSCQSNLLSSLDVSANINLTNLACDHNNIANIDVSSNTALFNFGCSYNQLTSLNVLANTSLNNLNCEHNQISSLNLINNAAITNLNCGENLLTTLNLSANSGLQTIACDYNQITNLNLTNDTNIVNLQVTHNQITSLNIPANSTLAYLYCDINPLNSLDVSGCSALIQLACSDSPVGVIDLSNNSALTILYCQNCSLTSLNVRNGNNLNLSSFYINFNPNLLCVKVDSVEFMNTTYPIQSPAVYDTACACNIIVNAGLDSSICVNNTLTLNGLVSGNTITGSWSTAGTGMITNPTILNPDYFPSAIDYSNGSTALILTSTNNTFCPAVSDTFLLSFNPLPLVNAGADVSICSGQTTILTATGATTYSWDNGATSDTTSVTPGSNTGYYVYGTDTNGCVANDYIDVFIITSGTISGSVTVNGVGGVNTGVVDAYNRNTSPMTLVGSSNITAGLFSITNLPFGNYVLRVTPDTIAYPGAIVTYAGDTIVWQAAIIDTVDCGPANVTNIDVIQTMPLTGSGIISGQVLGGNGPLKTWQQGDPIPGVDVALEQNPGSINLVQTTTDASGGYSFINVPVGNYSIYVDVPGLSMSATYSISITANTNNFYNAIFYVDSMGTIDTIRALVTSPKNIAASFGNISAYPNPFSNYTNIEYALTEKANVNMEVYNVLGEKVVTLVNANKDAGKYTEKFSAKNCNTRAGIYFVKIKINDKQQVIRLVEID